MKAKLSVVIPNFNGIDYLEDCIDSLFKQSMDRFEIIVVDDCSSDGSFEYIQSKYPEGNGFPQMKYIAHHENLGFATSVNDGISLAQTDYVLLLNNDTQCDEQFVINMYRAIRRSSRIFSVSARMVNLHNKQLMDNAGDFYNILGWARTPAKDKSLADFNKRQKIFSACGGAAIYNRSALLDIGGFDDYHFAYLEDVDLGYRALLYGYINIYEPKAVVYHAGSATSGSRYNDFKARLTARNNVFLLYKNMPDWQLVINSPFIIAGFIIKTLFYCKKGFGKSYFGGIIEGLKGTKVLQRADFKRAGIRRIMSIWLWLVANTRY